MASLTRARLRTQRLSNQFAAGPTSEPAEVARHLLAMQGQDLSAVCWAIGLRSGRTVADVHAAFDAGAIVRAWPLRGTLHALAAEDVNWILPLTAPRQLRSAEARRAELGLDAAVLSRADDVARDVLHGHALSRAEFTAALADAGIEVAGQRAYRIIWQLAMTGKVVWGPMRDGTQLLVLSDDWLPAADAVDRRVALGRLLRRYLAGHGPASLDDFAWWAGLTKADAAIALAVARERLAAVNFDGQELWTLADAAPSPSAPAFTLLPGFDEILLGYRDRSPALAPEHADAVVPGGNGVFQATVLSRGEIVGLWRRSVSAAGVSIRLQPFRPLTARERAAAAAVAKRYALFLGHDAAPLIE